MKFGIVGLGKMGMALAKHALEEGFELVAYNRSPEKVDEVAKAGAVPAYSLKELVDKLAPPRIVWLMVSAGRAVDKVLLGREDHRSSGDKNFLGSDSPLRSDLDLSNRSTTKDSSTGNIEALSDENVVTGLPQTKSSLAQTSDPAKILPSVRSPENLTSSGSLRGLVDLLDKGDIVIDGVNSHYKDSIRRGRVLLEKGIDFLDVGTSGGIEGARKGACFMVGGPEEAYKKCEPIFKALAQKDGYEYFGKSGSGHFVKMVHNGIEYAMMQALGEGINILDKSEFDIDLSSVAKVWNNGSIIQSRLVGWLQKALGEDPGLKNSSAEVGSLGTGKWTVEAAMELGVPATAIAQAVFARYLSRDPTSVAFRVVQALRVQFGGHTSGNRPE